MIFIFFSVFAGDYQNLIIDARNFALSGVSSSIPSTPFDNPSSSSFNQSFLGFDGGYIFTGFSTLFTLKGSLKKSNSGFGFLLFNQMISGIPDTRNALVDLNGNGELDDGEYLDSSKIVYRDAFQNLFLLNISSNSNNFYYGMNLKIFYENLMGERGIGGGLDIGVLYFFNNLKFGITLRDITSSIIIWKDTKEKINPSLIFGSSYRINIKYFSMTPCFDFILDDYGLSSLLGIGLKYRDMVEVLFGIKRGGISFGSGLYFHTLRFHYGLMIDYEEDFPLTHRITISKCFNK